MNPTHTASQWENPSESMYLYKWDDKWDDFGIAVQYRDSCWSRVFGGSGYKAKVCVRPKTIFALVSCWEGLGRRLRFVKTQARDLS